MSLFRRKGHSGIGLNAEPPSFPPVAIGEGGWLPFAPMASAHNQIGAYAHPPRTQYPAYWPDRQLNCGVNGISRSWDVQTPNGSDRPYFQMTTFPQNPRHLIQSGNRSGGTQPMTVMSESFVPRAYAQGVQQGAVAAGALGW